jgi:hypothetical protein
MRRALFAGLALGVVAGLLFVFHDTLALSVSWPVILGFGLWETVGRRGSRGPVTAVAAAVGVGFGYATFAVVAQFLPIIELSFGLVLGVAVGLLVIGGLLLRQRLPLAALLIGYAAFLGVFEPRWQESAASIRSHGLEDLTVALLGLLAGILAATLVRGLGDAATEAAEEERRAEAPRPPQLAVRGEAS